MTIISSKQFEVSYATGLPDSKGAKQLRLALNGKDNEVKIAVLAKFQALARAFDKLLSIILAPFGYKQKFIEIAVDDAGKATSQILNINSLLKRTLLSRDEIISKSPQQLSAILADPTTIIRKKKALNDYFPHVKLINLDSRKDRIDTLKNHLSHIGERKFSYVRQSAVVGKDLPKEEIEKMSKSNAAIREGRDDRPGRLGILMSHLQALKDAKNKNLPQVLILEDDARFIPEHFASNYVEKALGELPQDWGVCFLGYYEHERNKVVNFSEHLVKPGCPYDMHAYMVNASMFDTIIEAFEKELQKKKDMRACDVIMAEDITKSNLVYALKDNAVIQNDGQSNIVELYVRGNYHNELKKLEAMFPTDVITTKYTREGIPVMSPLIAGTLYQMMHQVHNIFTKHNIEYWAESGTLLGIERHAGFIPHDDDIDLSIAPGMEEKLKHPDVIADLKAIGLTVSDHWCGVKIFAEKSHPEGKTWKRKEFEGHKFEGTWEYKVPCMDIFFTKKQTVLHEGKEEEAIVYGTDTAAWIWPPEEGWYARKCEANLGGPKLQKKFGPLTVNTLIDGDLYCKRIYGPSCMEEVYQMRDHINEQALERRPVKLIDRRAPAYTQWDGLPKVDFS